MAYIILKTKAVKQPLAVSEPSGIQPMVIDFSKNRRLISSKLLYIAFGALASFVLTSLLALFVLGEQLNHLWRDAQNTAPHVVVAHADVKASPKIDEPATAFPATTLTPLPSKALILGKDFQQTKATKKVDLVPILERLPINSKPVKPSGFVEVETAPLLTQSATLQQQADNAVATGNTEKAIQLYLEAVRVNPKDDGLRSNCVALLLDQARSYDENGETDKALASYKKAQSLWQGDAQTARSIKARIEFLQN